MILTHSKNGRRQVKVVLNEPESMKCNLCQKEFRSNCQLRDHMNIKHGSITFSQKSLQTPFQNFDIADIEAHLGSKTDDENMECNSNQFECYVCFERYVFIFSLAPCTVQFIHTIGKFYVKNYIYVVSRELRK